MKYCEECKVSASESLNNCPLCGSVLVQGKQDTVYDRETAPLIRYPQLDKKRDSVLDFLRKKSWILCLTLIAAVAMINFLATPRVLWSVYVIIGLLTVQICVLSTLYKRRRLYALLGVLSLMVPVCACTLDIVVSMGLRGNLRAFGISLEYVVPAFLTAALIACDVMSWCDRSQYKYYLLTIWMLSFGAVLPQAAVWILQYGFRVSFAQWLTLTLFCFALVNFGFITVVYWKKLQTELIRKFFL